MSSCSQCGAVVRSGARFCGNCGASLSSGTSCPVCGSVNRTTARFCSNCSTELKIPCPSCGHGNRPSARFCESCQSALTPSVGSPQRFGTGLIRSQTVVHGRYQVLDLIDRGGMGAVYRAADMRLQGTIWALKEMSDEGLSPEERQTAIEQFQQEAQMLAALQHPNLPRVIDVFEEQGKYYLVMEYIDGQTLEEIMQAAGKPLPESRVLTWAEQLCDVLEYLHNQNPPIIYRDLKPANAMEERQSTTVKLIDFGIARFHKGGKKKDTTVLGTPGYAPPEQYGKGESDARSDVYALGVLVHHLLTGHDPSQNPLSLPPASALSPDISERVEEAIVEATELERTDRYQSASAFWKALAPPAPPKPKPKPPKPKKPTSKKPKLEASTRRIDFGDLKRGKSVSREVRVKNTGGQMLNGKAKGNVDWLAATPRTFSINDEKITVSADTSHVHLPRLQRPTPNILRGAWDKIEGIGWPGIAIILAIIYYTGWIDETLALALSLVGLQVVIWLAYWHARHIIPDATPLQGAIELETNGGDKTIDVEVTVIPQGLSIFIGWTVVAIALVIEFLIALAVLAEMAG